MTDKFFNAFPPETPQYICEEVLNRFLIHIEKIPPMNTFTQRSHTNVFHICDSVMGPLTIDEMITKCREMRSKYPKMKGTPSPVIEDLESIKEKSTIRTVILLDYEYEEKLNWLILTFK
jgi:hypothetical protein